MDVYKAIKWLSITEIIFSKIKDNPFLKNKVKNMYAIQFKQGWEFLCRAFWDICINISDSIISNKKHVQIDNIIFGTLFFYVLV